MTRRACPESVSGPVTTSVQVTVTSGPAAYRYRATTVPAAPDSPAWHWQARAAAAAAGPRADSVAGVRRAAAPRQPGYEYSHHTQGGAEAQAMPRIAAAAARRDSGGLGGAAEASLSH